MNIKKGDTVAVITGKEKGKIAKVTATLPKEEKVVLDNVNVVSKHQKPKSAQDKGGIVKKACPIDVSNVIIICQSCDKATRVAHKEVDGKKARICKKCGASLDKAMAKVVKKETKAEAKKETKTETKKTEKTKTSATKTKETAAKKSTVSKEAEKKEAAPTKKTAAKKG